jgi:hypothetical protein
VILAVHFLVSENAVKGETHAEWEHFLRERYPKGGETVVALTIT